MILGNLGLSFIVFLHLPFNMKMFTLGIIGIASVYPLAKRYTNYPQFILGIAFNSGLIIGAYTLNPNISLGVVIPMYLSGISWTLVYDTIYAYQDIEDYNDELLLQH